MNYSFYARVLLFLYDFLLTLFYIVITWNSILSWLVHSEHCWKLTRYQAVARWRIFLWRNEKDWN